VIGLLKRPLPAQETALTQDRPPRPRQDSNLQSQRAAADPLLRPQALKLGATLDTNIPTDDLPAGMIQRDHP
jgi:hypothetical protein